MGFFSLLNRSNMQSGQPENIADVVANFDAVAAVINGGIDNSNVNAAAALAISKLAGYPSDAAKVLRGDGTWMGASGGSSELDYAQITANTAAITANTEAAAVTIITGNPVVYDGSRVKVEAYFPKNSGSGAVNIFAVLLRDSTVVGQVQIGFPVANDASRTGVWFDTPPAGTHTYSVKAFTTGGTSFILWAGLGGSGNLSPAFIRVTKDPAVGPQGAIGPTGPQGAGAVGALDIQTFAANGTWNKPSGMSVAMIMVWGAGGGGGGGSRANQAAQRGGGTGGGGGAHRRVMLKLSALPATVPITIAVGGAGGLGAVASATDGLPGSVGGNTSFGSLIVGYGGGPGYGAPRLSGNPCGGGGGGSGQVGSAATTANLAAGGLSGGGFGVNFGANASSAGDTGGGGGGGGGSSPGGNPSNVGGYSVLGGGGGGGGASGFTDNSVRVAMAGGLSGPGPYTATGGDGGVAGTSGLTPTPGSPGADLVSDWSNGGSGGGGGGAGVSGASNAQGANGGAGGLGGGGGGGGGAGTGTVTPGSNGGNGGKGGDGYCVVICW